MFIIGFSIVFVRLNRFDHFSVYGLVVGKVRVEFEDLN